MNPFPSGSRLDAIVSLIEGETLADIGTDHAYVPITACRLKKIQNALACDVRPGPLARAVENIYHHGLQNRIETRLGDGLTPVAPQEADCIVIAGMGGVRILQILKNGLETARSAQKLVLQPQHDVPALRKTLHELHFHITDEHMVCEDHRFYTLISTTPHNTDDRWSEEEYVLGKYLMKRNDEIFRTYLEHESEKIKAYIAQTKAAGGTEETLGRLRALRAIYDFGKKISR